MRLAAGDWSALVAPERGGGLLALTRAGVPILRPTPAGSVEPFDLACFPLVPYANRIAHGVFDLNGEPHHLPANHPAQRHPLHGVGWLEPWAVGDAGQHHAVLIHRHEADTAWPWSYVARQELRLDLGGLAATLEVTSTDDRVAPVSLGFHPYFARAGVRSVRFASDAVWMTDADALPTQLAPADALADWRSGSTLDGLAPVDHCFTGWDGHARVTRDDGNVVIDAEGATLLHVYVPPGEAYFCAEPVTAMPDAINRGASRNLTPGETMRIAMTIRSA